ncbi:MAG: tetratricopeptide repeat protein [Chitinivibrionia bacterium]|nr:tetratricopeptide repeat protein [Chitinivibrionia bacterium]
MFLKRVFNFIPKNEFSNALDNFNRGDYPKALRKFKTLLADERAREHLDVQTIELYTCEAHVGMSKQHSESGRMDMAIEEMERAVALKPHFADLRYNLGNLYSMKNEYDQASRHLRKALEINPKFFKARVHLAMAMLRGGDPGGAAHELSLAAPICPNFYKERFNDLHQALRVKGNDEATDLLFREILEERPSSSQLSKELAVEAIQNGNNTEAIRELKKAIALNADYPDLHNYLGIAYGNGGMLDDSIEEFEIALKINPYYLKARLNLALALYEKGLFAEAHNQLSRVLEVQPHNQLAANLLSELRAVKNR